MEDGEVFGLEAPFHQQCHRQGIAHGQGGGGGCGRGQTQGAGLLLDRDIQKEVTGFRQRRIRIAAQGDQVGAQALDARQNPQQLVGLAAV